MQYMFSNLIAEVSARICRFYVYVLSQEAFLVTVHACTLLVGGFQTGVTKSKLVATADIGSGYLSLGVPSMKC